MLINGTEPADGGALAADALVGDKTQAALSAQLHAASAAALLAGHMMMMMMMTMLGEHTSSSCPVTG